MKRSILEHRDILFSIAGTIGRVAVVDADLANSNANQALAFVRLNDSKAHFGLVLQHLKSQRIKEEAEAAIVQGVQANVSLSSLGQFKITVPTASMLSAWNDVFGGIYGQQSTCADETRTLTRLRDLLLPKFLSGEIRIKDAEKLVGDAV